MAGDHIKVTLSAMESCSRSFSDCGDKLVAIAQSLAAASAAMQPAWDDPAQRSFEASMEELVKEFDKAYSCLRAMSTYSAYVAELYRATDQSAKSLL
jgi:WXG100 family type VII secretion target